jgi:hypothetical protein
VLPASIELNINLPPSPSSYPFHPLFTLRTHAVPGTGPPTPAHPKAGAWKADRTNASINCQHVSVVSHHVANMSRTCHEHVTNMSPGCHGVSRACHIMSHREHVTSCHEHVAKYHIMSQNMYMHMHMYMCMYVTNMSQTCRHIMSRTCHTMSQGESAGACNLRLQGSKGTPPTAPPAVSMSPSRVHLVVS